MMQDLGVLDKQADKIELEGSLEITQLAKEAEDWKDE